MHFPVSQSLGPLELWSDAKQHGTTSGCCSRPHPIAHDSFWTFPTRAEEPAQGFLLGLLSGFNWWRDCASAHHNSSGEAAQTRSSLTADVEAYLWLIPCEGSPLITSWQPDKTVNKNRYLCAPCGPAPVITKLTAQHLRGTELAFSTVIYTTRVMSQALGRTTFSHGFVEFNSKV